MTRGKRERRVGNLMSHLLELYACRQARDWVGMMTAEEAWERCDQPLWMIWWAARTSANSAQEVLRVVNDLRVTRGYLRCSTAVNYHPHDYCWFMPAFVSLADDHRQCDYIRSQLKLPWTDKVVEEASK